MYFSASALANDSIARIGTGGLELVKTDSIKMQKEILEISTKTIKVDYEFFNTSNVTMQALVAFPMPVYGFDLGVSAALMNFGPIKDFQVYSDGVKLDPKPSYKAFLNNNEISEELTKAGLTKNQIFITFAGCKLEDNFSCAISNEIIESLKKIGAYTSEGYTSKIKYALGLTWPVYKMGPTWDVEQTLSWPQRFEANKITRILHTYSPLVGGVYNYPLYDSKIENDIKIQAASVATDNSEACIDESFKKAYLKKINDFQKSGVKTLMVSLSDVEYVLGTGRNWAGPIQDFTLRIKKDSPDQLVSLCFPGKPKKIDPLTIEFTHTNFVPQDKLVVYFYSFRAE